MSVEKFWKGTVGQAFTWLLTDGKWRLLTEEEAREYFSKPPKAIGTVTKVDTKNKTITVEFSNERSKT